MSQDSGFKKFDRRAFLEGDTAAPAPSEGEEPAAVIDDKPTYVQELEARAERAEEQLKEYIKAYKEEVEGGLAKVKDRLEREAQRTIAARQSGMALGLLEVLDNLDRSLAAAQQGGSKEDLLQGLGLVRDQFFKALQELGLTQVPALGETFDPQIHEAAGLVPVEQAGDDGKVVSVLSPGYLLGERLVRPALVQVGKVAN